MQGILKFPSFSPITATCRAVYEKVNRLNVAVARAKSLAMLVANGIPPNQKTNAWMTAVEQYLRFLSLAGTAAFATWQSLQQYALMR
jgi:hypothetical protein